MGVILLLVSMMLIPISAQAAFKDYQDLGAGVVGRNNWEVSPGSSSEIFEANTKIKYAGWSSNNDPWTKAHARYGSYYGQGSSYTDNSPGDHYAVVIMRYDINPRGFLGAYSEHSRNDQETAWLEIPGTFTKKLKGE
ncbi:hypothetical protein [Paenilisteria weihenstephanensis]|nr:hypothetical protein [Listeria weihenstephanensis]